MKAKYFVLSFLSIIIFSHYANSQTTLSAGDLAIIGIRTDNPDDFSFVLLVDIVSSTEINFTDKGWITSSNSFRSGEGMVTFTASTAYSAGDVLSLSGNSSEFSYTTNIKLGVGGDQIIAFQGTLASPTLISAAQTNSLYWQTGSINQRESNLPSGLTNGTTAVAAGKGIGSDDEWDNIWYSGSITAGSKNELLAQIGNQDNWSGKNNASYYDPITSFTVYKADNPESFSSVGSSTTHDPSLGQTWRKWGGGSTKETGQ